ncbi:PDDEXK nuclease domain-containing protein [bacterium]|nr:PDDEXK nuclease domain-containing protein [bacterium]
MSKVARIKNPDAVGQSVPVDLVDDLRSLIESARQRVASAVNAEMVLLYWSIGERIKRETIGEGRAAYGQEIVYALSRQLSREFGSGFSRPNLFNMIKFAEVFPDRPIVHALSAQLSWTHFRRIIYLNDPLKRDFYAEMCRIERWSTRTLDDKINKMLFERTALAKKSEEFIRRELDGLRDADRLNPDMVFRDPYFLDFLSLKDSYSEKDLESAILRELEAFILELGIGFSFVARQKRITVDHEDYYIDLLFYHRKMRRLVVIDLKLDRFKAAYKGQMELYLRWLDKYEMQPGEESPLGLILCAGKSSEHVELLQLEKSGVRVAEYLTDLPPRDLLEKKLHDAIYVARERIASGIWEHETPQGE